jgi:hypothetical protein
MTLNTMLGFEPQISTERAPRGWPKFMTARVAADYSDSSPWTVRRHVRPCGRRGRTLVYSIESVETWMRGHTIAQRGEAAPSSSIPRPTVPNAASLARIRDLAKTRKGDRPDVEAVEDHVAA